MEIGPSTPGAKAGHARISARRQTFLQYMLACAAQREWSFWSTTTFFVACWMNITLAAIDLVGESFGSYVNVSYVLKPFNAACSLSLYVVSFLSVFSFLIVFSDNVLAVRIFGCGVAGSRYNETVPSTNGTTAIVVVVTELVYSADEQALYTNYGSVYNWLNVISCTLFVINPVFDWLYYIFNSSGYTTPLQARLSKILH